MEGYRMKSEIKDAIENLKEVKELLKQFRSRDEAIKYLSDETGLPVEECVSAYDFFAGIDFQKKNSNQRK